MGVVAELSLGIDQGAGEVCRNTLCRITGELFVVPSRCRHSISSIAVSSDLPVNVVSLESSSSILSVLSSSSRVVSLRMGRQMSYVVSDTMTGV